MVMLTTDEHLQCKQASDKCDLHISKRNEVDEAADNWLLYTRENKTSKQLQKVSWFSCMKVKAG